MNRRTRFRIFMRDDFTCQYCGLKAPDTQLHVDHRYPKSMGGKDADDNFVTACIACNSGKSNLILPVRFTYFAGHKDGQTVLRRDTYPIEWVWEMKDGSLWSLNDAFTSADEMPDRVVSGPWHYDHVDSPDKAALKAAIDASRDEFQNPQAFIRGAYVTDEMFPTVLGAAPRMVWFNPTNLLARLEFRESHTSRDQLSDP